MPYRTDRRPLDAPGRPRSYVDLATPDGPDDRRASGQRLKALKAELPDILGQFEQAGLTKWCMPRSPSTDEPAVDVRLRGLGVQLCFSLDPAPDEQTRKCSLEMLLAAVPRGRA